MFMATVDSSMVNIALPTIMAEFHSPLKDTEWVVLIYLLTITSSLLIWGNLSDRLGRHRIYPLGMAIFAAGSLACSSAPELSCLVGARFIQAGGASMMMATGPAIIKEAFPGPRLGRILGLISVATSLGLMSGPLAGGLIMEYFSWRAIFMVTVPVGALFAVFGSFVIPRSAPRSGSRIFNWLSALAWTGILSFFAIAVTHAASPSWSAATLVQLFALSGLCAVSFIIMEKKAKAPFLPVALIGRRYFYTALACAALSFMVLFTVLIMAPFFLDRVQGMAKAKIGLVMMVIPLAVLLVAPVAGRLSETIAAKKLSTLGLGLSTGGLFVLSTITPEASALEICIKLAILGCGQAMFLAPNSASVLKRMESEHSGKAAALLATARNFGMLAGIGIAGLAFSFTFSRLTGGLDMRDFTPAHTAAFMSALRGTFLVAGAFGTAGTVISWLREA